MIRPLPLLLLSALATAAVTELPSVLGPGMVLQRERRVPVWGWDAPGAAVTVSFRGAEAKAVAGADGRWETQVATGTAGGPFTLAIAGSTRHELADVLVGEVWIAGGQSNMWWQLSNCADAATHIAAAGAPQLRWYDANTGEREAGWNADQPQRTVKAGWVASSPQTAPGFAGTAWHFARRLQAKLGVPVGIVHLAVPGTAAEPWISPPTLRGEFPEVVEINERRRANPGSEKAPKAVGCGTLYNGMVAPCAPFAARGFLWWQGESNASQFGSYRALFPALIADWRGAFRLPNAPFLFVELAGFGTKAPGPVEDAPWPALRDAQRAALRLPNTAMVCTLDILAGWTWEIHPPRKELAGERLFRAAAALAYGEAAEWSGPQPRSFAFADADARIAFAHAGGLRARDGAVLEGFAVAGDDRVWHAATATVSDDTVTARAADEPAPVAVRYAWRNNPRECNLENAAGLPACAFRSDDWPLCTPK